MDIEILSAKAELATPLPDFHNLVNQSKHFLDAREFHEFKKELATTDNVIRSEFQPVAM
jgi:hypothetical protein